jgi:hypothetical protein
MIASSLAWYAEDKPNQRRLLFVIEPLLDHTLDRFRDGIEAVTREQRRSPFNPQTIDTEFIPSLLQAVLQMMVPTLILERWLNRTVSLRFSRCQHNCVFRIRGMKQKFTDPRLRKHLFVSTSTTTVRFGPDVESQLIAVLTRCEVGSTINVYHNICKKEY